MSSKHVRDAGGKLVYVDKKIAEISASLAAVDAAIERIYARYNHPDTSRYPPPHAAEQVLFTRAQKLIAEQSKWYKERERVARLLANTVAKSSTTEGQTPGRSGRRPDAISEEALYAVRLLEGKGSVAECKIPSQASLRLGSRRPICLCGRCSTCLSEPGSEFTQDPQDAWTALLACPTNNDCLHGFNNYRRSPTDKLVESVRAMREYEEGWEQPPSPQVLRSLDGSSWCEVKSVELPGDPDGPGHSPPASLVARRRSFTGSLGLTLAARD